MEKVLNFNNFKIEKFIVKKYIKLYIINLILCVFGYIFENKKNKSFNKD